MFFICNPLLPIHLKIDQSTLLVADLATEMHSREHENNTVDVNASVCHIWLNICVNTCEEKFMCCHTCFKCTEIDRLQKPAKHASLQPSELET